MALFLALAAGCRQDVDKDNHMAKQGPSTDELRLQGDKTIYGLACEGCNDSIVLLLPNDGSDPIR